MSLSKSDIEEIKRIAQAYINDSINYSEINPITSISLCDMALESLDKEAEIERFKMDHEGCELCEAHGEIEDLKSKLNAWKHGL
jgi:hypothetical protein